MYKKAPVKIMNLIKYNTKNDPHYFSLNNVDLTSFLSIWELTRQVELKGFYGYHVRQTFAESDFPHPLTIETFVSTLQTNNVTHLNWIVLQIDGLLVEISDAYEYHVNADAKQIFDFATKVFSTLLKADFLIQDFEKFQDIYVLVDKGALIQTFDSFDDFLESEYADEM
jgi:hypothetical protein